MSLPPHATRAVTVADLLTLRHGDVVRFGDGTRGPVAFCALSASYAPDFPVADWPPERYDGLMIRDEMAGLVAFDRAGFEEGEIWWALGEEPA